MISMRYTSLSLCVAPIREAFESPRSGNRSGSANGSDNLRKLGYLKDSIRGRAGIAGRSEEAAREAMREVCKAWKVSARRSGIIRKTGKNLQIINLFTSSRQFSRARYVNTIWLPPPLLPQGIKGK